MWILAKTPLSSDNSVLSILNRKGRCFGTVLFLCPLSGGKHNGVDFIDNSAEILRKFYEAKLRALEKCGLKAEGYAKKLCLVDTGNLRNSISHTVRQDSAYVGTNCEYAPYVEMGTGKYYSGGRQTPWAYQDAGGEWHWTHGNEAKPYLKPAAADHAQEYREIIKNEMKNG